MEIGLKMSATLPCSMLGEFLMVMGEVDIGIRPTFLPPIIKVILVDHKVFIVMVITGLNMGLRPANFFLLPW